MLEMMSSSPAAPKDKNVAHSLGCVSNHSSSPVSTETDVLARQFEFETTAAAAEGVIILILTLTLIFALTLPSSLAHRPIYLGE